MGTVKLLEYSKETRMLVFWRTIIDWTAGLLLTFAILLMPVSESMSISRLTVFFTPILSFFLIDEKISIYEIMSIIGGFLGILMILNPSSFNSIEQRKEI